MLVSNVKSFFFNHREAVFCFSVVLLLLCFFVASLFLFSSCCVFWTADVKYKNEKQEVSTSVVYEDSRPCEGSENNSEGEIKE
jgi:predicted membrane protein